MAHDILDAFRQSGIVTVTEDAIVPAGLSRKSVEIDVILENPVIVMHLQVVDTVFGISSRVNGAELGTEGSEEGGPVVHPIRSIIGVQNGRFKIL